jgi:hypothetical protein
MYTRSPCPDANIKKVASKSVDLPSVVSSLLGRFRASRWRFWLALSALLGFTVLHLPLILDSLLLQGLLSAGGFPGGFHLFLYPHPIAGLIEQLHPLILLLSTIFPIAVLATKGEGVFNRRASRMAVVTLVLYFFSFATSLLHVFFLERYISSIYG